MSLLLHKSFPTALLALADGSIFVGSSIGAPGQTIGEVVFNTSITGYQEMLTDPGYCGQIITLTYPHIGNYGTNAEDVESGQVFAAGLVIQNLPLVASSFRCEQSLQDYLSQTGTVAIANVDTRKLTRHIRQHGAQNGCILTLSDSRAPTQADIDRAVAAAKAAPAMAGRDMAREVSCKAPYGWRQGEWTLEQGYTTPDGQALKVVVYDLGVKRNFLRMLAQRGCDVTVVPAQTPAEDVLAMQPKGVFLSNGPGDPQPCSYAIEAARVFMAKKLPVLGIGLGHQVLALASGAKTFKMPFGRHGGNHPVKHLETGRVSITSQRHGFAVDAESLPANLRTTHISLFDGTVQGLERTDCPAFGLQGHPASSPDAHDIANLFERFTQCMRSAQ